MFSVRVSFNVLELRLLSIIDRKVEIFLNLLAAKMLKPRLQFTEKMQIALGKLKVLCIFIILELEPSHR